jgi:hypothetical protein
VEKVNKQNENNTELNEEINIEAVEEQENKNNIDAQETNNLKDETQKTELINNQTQVGQNTDIDYEKKIAISEIYSIHGIENSNINTVFMLKNLINALPQNLPQDVIKQSVMNIIAASNIDLKALVADGERRLKALNNVETGYCSKTNKSISQYKEEIAKLTNQISNYEEQIKNKENMLEEQTYMINEEVENINGIIEFFQK